MAKIYSIGISSIRYSPLIWLHEKHSAGFFHIFAFCMGESQIHLSIPVEISSSRLNSA